MQDISKTLYIPLAARIYISKKFPEFFYDKIALKLENNKNLPPCKEYAGFASVARTKIFDKKAKNFAQKFNNEQVAIVHLGAGLDSQNYRLQKLSNAKFYQVDFLEVIELRKKLLGVSDNEILISSDLFNFSWLKEIKEEKAIFIASGVFQYFDEGKIIILLKEIQKYFPNGIIVFDATNKFGLSLANLFVKTNANLEAKMNFYVNNSKTFAKKAGLTLISEEPFFSEVRKIKNLKLSTKISTLLADKFKMAKIITISLS